MVPSKAQFRWLKQILRAYLWSKYGGKRGDLPLVPWDVCTMPKHEGCLGLIAVASQDSILAANWVLMCLKESAPWFQTHLSSKAFEQLRKLLQAGFIGNERVAGLVEILLTA